jgi:DNA-binding CsgD family transcriptional regulator
LQVSGETVLFFVMADLSDIVKSRGNPGIVVVDDENRILYLNREAMQVLPDIAELPERIRELCECLKGKAKSGAPGAPEEQPFAILPEGPEGAFSARAFFLSGNEQKQRSFLVLLERIAERRTINIDKVRGDFNLTPRETDVLVLLNEGCSNREIAGRLFITEQTAKDHLRHIMRKMNVTSRSAVLARIR